MSPESISLWLLGNFKGVFDEARVVVRDPFLKRPGAQDEELAENTVRTETIILRM